MAVNENIKIYRKKRGYTQKQLGAMCNPEINEANIRKYELGKANPKIETIERIAAALNVSVLDLLGDISTYNDEKKQDLDYASAFDILVESLGYTVKFRSEEDLYVILSGEKVVCTFDTGDYFDMIHKVTNDLKFYIQLKSFPNIDYMSDISTQYEED